MAAPHARDLLVEVEDLKVHFLTDDGTVRAVDGVTFAIPRGKTVCIVGKSGSGKSITGRSLMDLLPGMARIAEGGFGFVLNRIRRWRSRLLIPGARKSGPSEANRSP